MPKEITYLAPFPASEHVALAWGFERCASRGIDVCHVDLSAILGARLDHAPKGAESPFWQVRVPASLEELDELLRSRRHGPVVDFVAGMSFVGPREGPVFEVLKDVGSQIIVVYGGAVPSSAALDGGRLLQLLRRATHLENWKNLLARKRIERQRAAGVRYALPRQIFSCACPARDALLRRYPQLSTSVVPVNSFDFDRYLDWVEAGGSVAKDGTVLFLDEGLTHHFDWAFLGGQPVNAEAYYSSLVGLFDRIERLTGLRVRVAGHPRVDRESRGDVFGGREVVYGDTIAATAKASGVVSSASTALSFATLLDVPILLVETRDMARSGYSLRVKQTARALDIDVHKIDDERALSRESLNPADWPRGGLRGYRDTYVIDVTAARRNTWDIVAESLF